MKRTRFYTSLPFAQLRTAKSCEELNFSDTSKLLDGWVYVLSNESMPGLFKVGMTSDSPEARARDLSRATGVPTPFKIEKSFHVKNPAQVERSVHEDLAAHRVSGNREFFKCDIETIFEALHEYEAWESGNCKLDIFVNKKFITNDTFALQNKTLKITTDLYERIEEESFGDINAVVENILTLMTENLNCNLFFEDRGAIALPSGEFDDRHHPAYPHEKPTNIEVTNKAKGVFE